MNASLHATKHVLFIRYIYRRQPNDFFFKPPARDKSEIFSHLFSPNINFAPRSALEVKIITSPV